MNDEEARAQFFKQTPALGSTAFEAIFFLRGHECVRLLFLFKTGARYWKWQKMAPDGKKYRAFLSTGVCLRTALFLTVGTIQ